MRFRVLYVLFGFFLLFGCTKVQAQLKKEKDIRDYIPTENLDPRKEANRLRNKPDRKNIDYIIKSDLDGILYGNPCAIEETRKMGFEYVFMPEGLPGAMNPDERFENNFLVNLKLIFTRSPFWKLILNRRIKKCRTKSGDFVG
ncbi:MAG: hypothetical protein ABJ004_09945 [Cyclobacteriaceae bacterium]